MSRRFDITEMHICPFDRVDGQLRPNLKYPKRYCVLDKEKEIAIDIKTKLKYIYVITSNNKEFMHEEYKKIQGNKRVAIFPLDSCDYSKIDLKGAQQIIESLRNNEEFQDGNEVFDNEKYLEYIENEQLNNQNKSKKTKKIGKRRK